MPVLLPHGTLVLVIDGSRMRILRNDGAEAHPDWIVIEEDRQDLPSERQLGSRAPGRSFESASATRHAYPGAERRDERMDEFADEALERLAGHLKNGCGAILIAPPDLLGQIRKSIDPQLKRRIIADFAKDLTKHPPAQIGGFLRDARA